MLVNVVHNAEYMVDDDDDDDLVFPLSLPHSWILASFGSISFDIRIRNWELDFIWEAIATLDFLLVFFDMTNFLPVRVFCFLALGGDELLAAAAAEFWQYV